MRKVLILGGSYFIGRRITEQCLEDGWEVSLLNRGSQPWTGRPVTQLTCDREDAAAMKQTLKGRTFDAVIDVNLKGTFNCCKAAAQRMMKQRYGRIVNMSSVVGVAGNAGQANYAASKAGVIGLTKSLARELARRNITANAVAPGFIATDMTDALSDAQREAIVSRIGSGRLGEPDDIAHLVRFLASDEASYITGQVICVDGGMSL